jgi:hypothetical protein
VRLSHDKVPITLDRYSLVLPGLQEEAAADEAEEGARRAFKNLVSKLSGGPHKAEKP